MHEAIDAAPIPEPPSETCETDRLRALGVLRLRAPNPGPLTLSGTNSWLVGRDPTWLVDPGPALESHLAALLAAVAERGGLGGIALTHDHADHVQALAALREHHPAPVAAARGEVDVTLREGTPFGPLQPLASPGHAPDHFAFLVDGVCFTGDAVLGEGSVFIAPDPGALAGYLAALQRLRDLPLTVLCPGHGPAVWRPREWIDAYLEHRLERERRLLAALQEGRRTTEELLDAAWSEVPAPLRPAAAVTLRAHLDKLAEEDRLAPDVQRGTS
ncbi:MAG TPA: MBL fold metallo-hydrolase [Solirubrobacteraceae bacterium]|jgi:glyoxylase-like metal-dependent hydrolase (beta-lactamase superfamily II)|nr:MBL fold metallo-hydrolase [Solirubrobacteraceae bacterium]